MKCAVHTEVEATGYCRNCGKAMCAECARDVRGVLYCETCLADLVTKPAAALPANVGGSNPALAALLGFVPGLGAVYNNQYMKALVHVVIFASLVGFVNTDAGERTQPAGGLAIAAFIIYMAIEAHRTARAKSLGLPCTDPFGNIGGGRVPIGPLILIGLGVLFLLDKFNYLPLERIFEFWPVFLIALGVWLLWRRMGSRATGS